MENLSKSEYAYALHPIYNFGLIFLVEYEPSFVILAHIVKLVSHNGRKIERVKQKFTKVSSVENF